MLFPHTTQNVAFVIVAIVQILYSIWLVQRKRQLNKRYAEAYLALQRDFEEALLSQRKSLAKAQQHYYKMRQDYEQEILSLQSEDLPLPTGSGKPKGGLHSGETE